MEQGPDSTIDQSALQSNQPETEDIIKARKNVRGGAVTCYVIAGLTFFAAILILGMRGQVEEMGVVFDDTIAVLGVVLAFGFIGLGLWSRKQPYQALLIATVIYAINAGLTLVNYFSAGGGAGGFRFVIIGVLLGLLIRGFIGANKLRKFQRGF